MDYPGRIKQKKGLLDAKHREVAEKFEGIISDLNVDFAKSSILRNTRRGFG